MTARNHRRFLFFRDCGTRSEERVVTVCASFRCSWAFVSYTWKILMTIKTAPQFGTPGACQAEGTIQKSEARSNTKLRKFCPLGTAWVPHPWRRKRWWGGSCVFKVCGEWEVQVLAFYYGCVFLSFSFPLSRRRNPKWNATVKRQTDHFEQGRYWSG